MSTLAGWAMIRWYNRIWQTLGCTWPRLIGFNVAVMLIFHSLD